MLAVENTRVARAADHVHLEYSVNSGNANERVDQSYIALVSQQTDLAIDMLLRDDYASIDKFALGAEVHAVVDEARPRDGAELVTEFPNLGVHNERLDVNVGQATG